MSSMGDFASAIGGGGGADVAPPPEASATPDQGQQDYGSPAEALDAAESALHAYIQMEPDHSDRLAATKCLTQITQLKMNDAQQLGQTASLGGLAAALQGGGGGPPTPGTPPPAAGGGGY